MNEVIVVFVLLLCVCTTVCELDELSLPAVSMYENSSSSS